MAGRAVVGCGGQGEAVGLAMGCSSWCHFMLSWLEGVVACTHKLHRGLAVECFKHASERCSGVKTVTNWIDVNLFCLLLNDSSQDKDSIIL